MNIFVIVNDIYAARMFITYVSNSNKTGIGEDERDFGVIVMRLGIV